MATIDEVRAIIGPLVDERGLDLYDVEQHQAAVRVLVDKAGGVDVDTLAELSRAVSRALDDRDPVAGRYTLEVSSPGVERPLRRPEHFAAAAGSRVTLKTRPDAEGDRRVTGVLAVAGERAVTVRADDGQERTVAYDDIESARTLYDWDATKHKPKTIKPKKKGTT